MSQIVIVLSTVVNALLLGHVSRRLLGVPVGWPRTFLVSLVVSTGFGGVIGLLGRIPAFAPFTTSTPDITASTNQLQFVLVISLSVAWAVALGLAVLVVLEALVPTGSLTNPVAWLQGLPSRRRRARRYTQIVRIAVRHGLGRYLRRSRARRATSHDPLNHAPTRNAHSATTSTAGALREALTEGGVTFVKLGQMLATRPDLIGPDFASELGRLQSSVTPCRGRRSRPWSAPS